jgi:hypothetical protein
VLRYWQVLHRELFDRFDLMLGFAGFELLCMMLFFMLWMIFCVVIVFGMFFWFGKFLFGRLLCRCGLDFLLRTFTRNNRSLLISRLCLWAISLCELLIQSLWWSNLRACLTNSLCASQILLNDLLNRNIDIRFLLFRCVAFNCNLLLNFSLVFEIVFSVFVGDFVWDIFWRFVFYRLLESFQCFGFFGFVFLPTFFLFLFFDSLFLQFFLFLLLLVLFFLIQPLLLQFLFLLFSLFLSFFLSFLSLFFSLLFPLGFLLEVLHFLYLCLLGFPFPGLFGLHFPRLFSLSFLGFPILPLLLLGLIIPLFHFLPFPLLVLLFLHLPQDTVAADYDRGLGGGLALKAILLLLQFLVGTVLAQVVPDALCV